MAIKFANLHFHYEYKNVAESVTILLRCRFLDYRLVKIESPQAQNQLMTISDTASNISFMQVLTKGFAYSWILKSTRDVYLKLRSSWTGNYS